MKIRTPRGNEISRAEYVRRTDRRRNLHPCEYGHLDCALWEEGPCGHKLWAEENPPEEN